MSCSHSSQRHYKSVMLYMQLQLCSLGNYAAAGPDTRKTETCHLLCETWYENRNAWCSRQCILPLGHWNYCDCGFIHDGSDITTVPLAIMWYHNIPALPSALPIPGSMYGVSLILVYMTPAKSALAAELWLAVQTDLGKSISLPCDPWFTLLCTEMSSFIAPWKVLLMISLLSADFSKMTHLRQGPCSGEEAEDVRCFFKLKVEKMGWQAWK
jgi:hypothetical protein